MSQPPENPQLPENPRPSDTAASTALPQGTPRPGAAAHAAHLGALVKLAPSSYHAAHTVAALLERSGFRRQVETEPWNASPGGHVLVRDGAVVAWHIPAGANPVSTGFRIVGSHTDSPGFKVKPDPALGAAGWQQVGVEVYGGPLTASWTDRELGIAGRVVTVDGTEHLVRLDRFMRIPQLAIHLNRQVNSEGLTLDPQTHLQPVHAVGEPEVNVLDLLAASAGVDADAIAGHDLYAFPGEEPGAFGAEDAFWASSRLDNLASVHASLVALVGRHADDADADAGDTGHDIAVLAAFDHEEVGSATRSGAAGPLLEDVLRRTAAALGADVDGFARMIARSSCVSADAGHAVHPNYAGHHDPVHQPVVNGGPLLKVNAQQRYASDAPGAALWRRACAAAGVATQTFVSNNQIPCGSTIGPITATRLGIRTVDVGVPLLSMHSAREMAGVADLHALTRAVRAYWAGA